MVENSYRRECAASPLVGLFIVALLDTGELVGRIVATTSDLAVVEALAESEIQGAGLLLLKLGGIALPQGHCRLFRSREDITHPVLRSNGASRHQPPQQRSMPHLAAIDGVALPNPQPSSS